MKKSTFILPTAILMAVASCATHKVQKSSTQYPKIQPVEQAPPADRGQNNFGGTHTTDTTGRAARLRAMRQAQNVVRTVHFNELSMSDPFIYPDPETKTYYLTSSGGRMWKSKDLVTWEGAYNIIDLTDTWCEKAGFAAAAEIHKIGKYIM